MERFNRRDRFGNRVGNPTNRNDRYKTLLKDDLIDYYNSLLVNRKNSKRLNDLGKRKLQGCIDGVEKYLREQNWDSIIRKETEPLLQR